MSKLVAVEITTVDGPVISRIFTSVAEARKWAAWTATKWPTRIMLGGQGGQEVK